MKSQGTYSAAEAFVTAIVKLAEDTHLVVPSKNLLGFSEVERAIEGVFGEVGYSPGVTNDMGIELNFSPEEPIRFFNKKIPKDETDWLNSLANLVYFAWKNSQTQVSTLEEVIAGEISKHQEARVATRNLRVQTFRGLYS